MIWTPNNTFYNRIRQRLGLSIDPSEAVELCEWLKQSTPQKSKEVEIEISRRMTEERVKQIHESVRRLLDNAEEL